MSWIHDEIRAQGGAVTFRDFMELALYHPAHGYYTVGPVRAGRGGDYLTAPTASPWYARVVARIVSRMAVEIGEAVRLVDVAAADGSFLVDVRETLEEGRVHDTVAVEPSPARRRELRVRLPETSVVADVDDIPPSTAPTVVHACELYDALPVHRAVVRGDELLELWVEAVDDGLAWLERPAPAELSAYFAAHRVTLADGQLAEASLTASDTHRRLLSAAAEGVCLVLDYGYPAARLYDPRGRPGGSLTTFTRHRFGRDPLEAPGAQDLTAHVNWDDLRSAAEDAGWHEVALLPLAELLVRGGIADELDERGLGMEATLDATTVAARQEVKRLLDPDGMGSDLKALVQATPDLAATVRAALGLDTT